MLFEEKLFAILDQFADVKPYVKETVTALREKGIKIGSTTGYTDAMMAIVAPKAAENGYAPDAWFSPDAVGQNMEALGISSAEDVVKVGDTISDIKEGKHAGVYTIGVIEGSSELGLSQKEYEALSDVEKQEKAKAVKKKFMAAGADAVIANMRELMAYIQ